MSAILEGSEAAILGRVFQPASGNWSRAAAEATLGIGFDKADLLCLTDLPEKAKTGELSELEAETLENYRHFGKLLELMKSRARLSLQGT